MGSTYDLIKRMENDADFLTLLKKGMVAISVLDQKVYYEYYMNDLKATNSKVKSVMNTAIEYNKSESTINRAIRFMK